MTTVLTIQRRLISLGYNPGGADGLIGPKTLTAIDAALSALEGKKETSPPSPAVRFLPEAWLPWAQMQRIILHWTAGNNKASTVDKAHYHILIEGDGTPVKGVPSITANQAPVSTGYAAHTLNCNSGSIGISLCGMTGANEKPFSAGKAPLTRDQWEAAIKAVADLCRRYSIPVTPSTVLSHAEVQGTLGIQQRGKWDIAILPFEPALNTATKVGDAFRAAVKANL